MPPLYHAGDYGLCHDKGRGKVNVYHLAELSGAHLGHGHTADYAGVINQYVDGARFIPYPLHHGHNGALVGHVADIAPGLYAQLPVRRKAFIHELLIDVVENHRSPGLGVGAGNGEAYAVGGPGNQGNLAL